jgi:hypothetical protein
VTDFLWLYNQMVEHNKIWKGQNRFIQLWNNPALLAHSFENNTYSQLITSHMNAISLGRIYKEMRYCFTQMYPGTPGVDDFKQSLQEYMVDQE